FALRGGRNDPGLTIDEGFRAGLVVVGGDDGANGKLGLLAGGGASSSASRSVVDTGQAHLNGLGGMHRRSAPTLGDTKGLALSAIASSLSIQSHADPGPMPRRARPRWQRFHQLAEETVNGLDGFTIWTFRR